MELNSNLIAIREPCTTHKNAKIVAFYNPYTGSFIKHFKNSDIRNFTEETLKTLYKDYVLIDEGEELTIDSITYNPKSAEIYIELTEACNFSCPGCAVGADRYEQGKSKTLTLELLSELLTKTFKAAEEKGISKIKLKWSGGEPMMTLPFSLIVQAQELVAELKVTYNIKAINQVILTNGSFLTKNNLDKLEKDEFHVSVSLWGLGASNALARNPKTPNGSYENIVTGIRYLYENDYSFNINHVVTPANAHQLTDFIETLWDIKSQRFMARNWSGCPRPIPLGINYLRPQTQKQSELLVKIGYKKMLEGTKQAFPVIKNIINEGIQIQPLNHFDYLTIYDVSPVTCGSGFNYIAIGPRGFANCHEGLYNMKNNLDTTDNIFDVVNAEYKNNRNFLYGAYKKFPNLDSPTSTFLSLHGGSGCPRNILIEVSGYNQAGAIAVEVYAHIYKDLLELEHYRRSKSK